MAVALRLRQEGAHNRPVFRIVAVEHRKKRDGGFLEILGYYDPQKEKNGCNIDLAKVDAWIAKGAQASDTVRSLVKKARAAAK
ncbi:MAG: 30S ribosomal protein S16 [Verrucomicrobiaceae bacterium]|nr:30S ribosomal protein S16 [Verrucomicrobiaceae bacterium]